MNWIDAHVDEMGLDRVQRVDFYYYTVTKEHYVISTGSMSFLLQVDQISNYHFEKGTWNKSVLLPISKEGIQSKYYK